MSCRVVIVGGGFGGLAVARRLTAGVDVTLIDRRNFHLFQPLLYQMATGGLSAANIAGPLRSILRRRQNCQVLLAEVVGFDLAAREVLLADGERAGYDALVVATGSSHHYYGNEHWSELAPGLKTIEDATAIRRRVLGAFEQAERERDPDRLAQRLSFVVVGAGPTGVELAGALVEVARDTLRHEFRRIDPAAAKVVLVEGLDRVLPGYPAELSQRAAGFLQELGVDVRLGCRVTEITPGAVVLERGGQTQRLAADTVLWAAGVKASPLGRVLAAAAGIETDRAGRVPVGPDLTVAGHADVFVIGDLALCKDAEGRALPGVAPVAMQQGAYVARAIAARPRGRALPPFTYRDLGVMATIGRGRAVAALGGWRFAGFFAWLVWLFVHLLYIVEFHNRLLVLFQWAWNYLTWNRGARLITDPPRAAGLGLPETP